MRHPPSAGSAADFPRNVKMELPNQARQPYGVEFPARAMLPQPVSVNTSPLQRVSSHPPAGGVRIRSRRHMPGAAA